MYETPPSMILASSASPALLFGLMLLAAIFGGTIARRFHVPRVVGYLFAGVILRQIIDAFPGVQSTASVEPLQAIRDLSLGVILFSIGSVCEKRQLHESSARVWRISLMEICLTVTLVFVACFFVGKITFPQAGQDYIVLAALLAIAAVATAPAATLFVLQEYEAKGSITNTILGVTGVNNVVCIIGFHTCFIVMVSAGLITTTQTMSAHPLLGIGAMILGSLALGVIIGTVLSIAHSKFSVVDTLLIFFACFILLSAAEEWVLVRVHYCYNKQLAALITGVVFTNVAIDSQKLQAALWTAATPIMVGFFAMAGFNLHMQDLAHMGLFGTTFWLCRTIGKSLGAYLGIRWAGAPAGAAYTLGPALLCQAAVVIGLAAFVEHYWQSPLAKQFSTVILGSVVVSEMLGPFMVKRCVVRGGEVKAITLLSRANEGDHNDSVVRLTLQALGRAMGIKPRATSTEVVSQWQVKHIMRSNVQFIQDSDAFDDVLHFIEMSIYAHFPVVHADGTFAGVIHFADVRHVIYDPAVRHLITAIDLADAATTVVPADMLISELFDVFHRENTSLLPVVELEGSKRVIGVVEQRDVLRVLPKPS